MAKSRHLRSGVALNDGAARAPRGFRFDDLDLDTGQRRLWRGRTEIELPGRSFDLLAALVDAAPDSLSTDELMDRVWDGAVVSPATVAKRVELLRDALGDDSRQPRYIALVRGHGYRLIPGVGATDAKARRSRTPLLLAAIAILAVAAGTAYLFEGSTPPPEKSIAVLPFVSMSADPEGDVFADGLTEELSHTLARMGDLQVTGRTSSFYFKGRNDDLRDVGEMLGVAHVLEGSVRRSGNQLRVTAQLISTDDGFHLWSEAYDREMSDILDIQKDIARSVAVSLRASMRDERTLEGLSETSISPEAYALYLMAASRSRYRAADELGEAQALIEQVTKLAPEFAPGWNRFAAIHGRRLLYRDPDYDVAPDESLALIRSAIDRALAIDPNSGEAHAALAGLAWVFERDAAKAAPLIERALELDPWDLDFVSFAADFAKFIGRLDEALELEELLIARDPLCAMCRAALAASYLYAGRYDEAESHYRTLQSMVGGFDWSLGVLLLMRQEPARALEVFRRPEVVAHLGLQGQVMALHDLGRADESQASLAELVAVWGEEFPRETAQAFAHVGDLDRAFELLEQSIADSTADPLTDFPHPLYDPFRQDPRWQGILESIGRTPEQIAEIPFSLDTARDRLGL